MYCENCGAFVPEGARFCAECGRPAAGKEEQEQKEGARPEMPENLGSMHPACNKKSAMAELRRFGRSPLFLTGFMARALTSLLLLFPEGTAVDTAAQETSWMGEDMQQIMEMSKIYCTAGSAIPCLVGLVISAALIMIYMECQKPDREPFNDRGFAFLYYLSKAGFVITIATAAISALGLAVMARVYKELSRTGDDWLGIAGMLVFGLLLAISGLFILYFKKLMRMMGEVRTMVAGGPPAGFVSVYVGAVEITMGILNFAAMAILPGASKILYAASGISSVCFAMLLFNFKKKMHAYTEISANSH